MAGQWTEPAEIAQDYFLCHQFMAKQRPIMTRLGDLAEGKLSRQAGNIVVRDDDF